MMENNSLMHDDKLSSALTALHSDDVLTQNEAVSTLVQIGADAVPELTSLLKTPSVNRSQVMYALAQIGDSYAERSFLEYLEDDDEYVRSYAAQGLVKVGHPSALEACLLTLNDAADEIHLDQTPSVDALGKMGIKAVPSLLKLLTNEDEITRLHSQRALELIMMRHYGFRPGQGFPSVEAELKAMSTWRDHGNYDFADDAESRATAATRLRAWFNSLNE